MNNERSDQGLGSNPLFAAESFLPVQQFDAQARHADPERRLLAAVLADAINCFQRTALSPGGKSNQREAREAETWFMSDDRMWPFSFVNVCDVLGLDSSNLRQGLLRQQRGRVRVHAARNPRPVPVARGDQSGSVVDSAA